MTAAQNVLTMPAGRELNALVAEHVLGYRHLVGADVLASMQHADGPEGWPLPDQEVWVRSETDRYCKWCGDLPAYSREVADAWRVVEHFWAVTIERCEGVLPTYAVTISGRQGQRFTATGDTMPLAVCRAALLAKQRV